MKKIILMTMTDFQELKIGDLFEYSLYYSTLRYKAIVLGIDHSRPTVNYSLLIFDLKTKIKTYVWSSDISNIKKIS